ncbi:transmembrane domain-containing protein [Cryptosporidium canis]|uniref:Transmembrane domain-containing protein n=1 Tax=Cryptosporidium canis TaxID=195482 RepID=A0A9D5DMJ0_9CRYT|nr:transmembrane domain-containing protein [Cryptosporidium canis]
MEKPFTCENQTKSGFSTTTLLLLYVISAPMVGAPYLLPSAVKELLTNNDAYYWLDPDLKLTTLNSLCSIGTSSLLLSGVLGAYFVDLLNNRNTAILSVAFHILGWIFCFFLDKSWFYFPYIGICLWGVSTQLLTLTKTSISVFYDSKKHLVVAMVGGSVGMSFAYMQTMVNLVRYISSKGPDVSLFGLNPTQFVIAVNCLVSILWMIGFYFIIPSQPFVTQTVDYCTRVSISRSQIMNSLTEFDYEERLSLLNTQMIVEVNRCKEDIPYQWTLTFREQLFSVPTILFTIIYSLMWFVRLYFTVNMKPILLSQTGADLHYSESIINLFGLSLGTTFIASILVGIFVDLLGIYLFLVLFVASSLVILVIFASFTPYCFFSHLIGIVICVFCYSYFIGCSFSLFTTTFGYTHLNSTQGISSTIAGLFTLIYNIWDSYIQRNYKDNLLVPTIVAITINSFILILSMFMLLYTKRWYSHNSSYFFSINKKTSIIK